MSRICMTGTNVLSSIAVARTHINQRKELDWRRAVKNHMARIEKRNNGLLARLGLRKRVEANETTAELELKKMKNRRPFFLECVTEHDYHFRTYTAEYYLNTLEKVVNVSPESPVWIDQETAEYLSRWIKGP